MNSNLLTNSSCKVEIENLGVSLPDGDRRLTTRDAASILGVQPHALDVWRCTKRYPLSYYRVGRRIYYRLSDVLNFLEVCRQEG